jgi:hypothetical protein
MHSKRRRLRRTRKQRGRGDSILPEDILYEDRDVRILKPGVKKGILVFSSYKQPQGTPPLCETGLKTGVQLKSEGVDFGRSVAHEFIFFRAPYFTNPIDYTSIDTEIASSFGNKSPVRSAVWIRVDPDKTNVFSSELRTRYPPNIMHGTPEYYRAMQSEVERSKKTMTTYLQIIGENARQFKEGPGVLYNLITSRALPKRYTEYPFDNQDVSRQSEVLVRLPHLTPNYFVRCT